MKVPFESLESRRMLTGAISYNLEDATIATIPPESVPVPTAHLTHTGTLMIPGTSNNDKITVLPAETISTTNSGKTKVVTTQSEISVLGLAGGPAEFDPASVKRIVVDAAGGNDDVIISPNLKLHTTLLGGNGNDTLIGGGGSDDISGGAGKDMLFASSTTIVDANGKSTLYGLATAAEVPVQFVVASKAYNQIIATTTVTNTSSSIAQSNKIADSLDGGSGNDTLYAGNGPDTIHGGDGTDTLVIIGRGSTQPPQIIFRRGNDQRTFDGLTFSSIESIDIM